MSPVLGETTREAQDRAERQHEAELAETKMPWTEAQRGDWPGISAFLQVDGEVFHTYSTFGRGIEEFHNGYPYLDLTRWAARKRGKSRRAGRSPSG